MIPVGADYNLTGTMMHAMPGLPILHSRDLVNWDFVTYVFDRLDLGPDFRLEDGKEIYGQGMCAPSFRYHNGTYYIFANVNRFGLQVFRAKDVRVHGRATALILGCTICPCCWMRMARSMPSMAREPFALWS